MDKQKQLRPIAELWGNVRAAAYLGVTTGSLRRLCMMRRIPHYKPFGPRGRTLYDPADLADFVLRSRVSALYEGPEETSRAKLAAARTAAEGW